MIVKLPPDTRSRSRQGREKAWIKRLTGVDTSKSDGFAFQGEFRSFGETVEVPGGTWFLHYTEDRSGSGHLYGRHVSLLLTATSLDDEEQVMEVQSWDVSSDRGWALEVRDEIASLLRQARDEESAAVSDATPSVTLTGQQVDALVSLLLRVNYDQTSAELLAGLPEDIWRRVQEMEAKQGR